MEDIFPYIVPLAGMLLVYFIIRMRHDRRMRETNLLGMSQDEQRALADMTDMARRMEQRIENLERILDSELAGWRSRMPL